MLNVIIIDDEAMFRSYTRTILEGMSLDINISGEAKNGKDGLALLEQHSVDVALVDISMPIMDGLEFCKHACKQYPQLEVVLITGYNEFEYAKTAMKLGIQDYILKPFDENELEEAICSVKDRILKKRSHADALEQYETAVIKQSMDNLISDKYFDSDDKVMPLLDKIALGKTVALYRLVVIEEDYCADGWNTVGRRDLWKTAILNVIDEIISPSIIHFAFGSGSDVVVILMFESIELGKVYDYADFFSLCKISAEKLKLSITCAVGDGFADATKIRHEYNLVRQLISKKFIVGCGSVIDAKISALSNNFDLYPKVSQSTLSQLMAAGDMPQLEQYLSSLFEECASRRLSMDTVCMLYMELVNLCLNNISMRGMEISSVFGSDFFPYTDLKNISDIGGAAKRIVNIYATAADCFSQKFTRSAQIASQAKEIVLQSYADKDLSVESIAKKLFINAGYLRTVFKKELNTTVSTFIFDVRMQKAHELIASENIRLADISDMVGFNDISYFSRCFKKKYGSSPSEYAVLARNKNNWTN